jgi:hypothetical protein
MRLQSGVLAILVCLWAPVAASAAQLSPLSAPPLDSVEVLADELQTQRLSALRTDICSLGATLQDTCGPKAVEHLDTICAGASVLREETLTALEPFLVGPSTLQCPAGTLAALEQEARAQQPFPLCREAKRALANVEQRCASTPNEAEDVRALAQKLCGGFAVLDASRERFSQVLRKLTEAPRCDPSLLEVRATQGFLAAGGQEIARPAAPKSAASLPVSGDFQTMLLEGLTTFMLERARVESFAYVLDEVSDKLCKEVPNKPDGKPVLSARALFPLTCTLVTDAKKSGMLLIPGPMLHRTIVEDLQNLPERLAEVLPLAEQEQALASCSLVVGHRFGRGLMAKKPPLQLVVGALEFIETQPSCKTGLGLPEQGEVVRWVVLSKAVEAMARLIQDANKETLERWARNPLLVLEQLKPALDPVFADKLERVLKDIIPLAVQTELSVLALRSTEPGSDEQRAAFLQVARDSIALLSAIIQGGVELIPLQAEYQLKLVKVQETLKAVAALLEGDFSGGVTRLVSGQVVPVAQEPYKTMFQFSPLLVSLSTAKTSDEMAAAFEAAAAPVGSWRLKRQKGTLGLGARVGAIAGQEFVLDDAGQVPDGLTLGPWLPIGLDASLPAGGGDHTLGILVQVVDLGGLASARLAKRERTLEDGTQVEADVAPQIGFVQVVSPGVSLYWGIGRSPFVLSLGVSTSPALRGAVFTTAGEEVEKDYNVLRTSLSLSVDIPLYIR